MKHLKAITEVKAANPFRRSIKNTVRFLDKNSASPTEEVDGDALFKHQLVA